MKPYEEYKETGLLWLDRVPEHWEVKKIKHLFRERTEKGYPDEQLLAATQTKGVIPKSMYKNRTVTAQNDLHLLKLVRKGDFVISLRSFQGGIEYAYFQGIISPAYTIMVSNEEIEKGYFRHLAKSRTFLELLKLCVTGIREGQNIDYSMLKNSDIPIPPKEEQNQIVKYLDSKVSKINKFIKAKKKQIELLKEQKQAIINQAVTKGIDPDAKMKPSGIDWLGDIPEGWEVRPLKHFVKSNIETLTESFDKNATINYIDISTVGFGELKLKPVQYVFKEAPSRARRVIHVGDTIISTVRTYLKSMCYIDEELEGYIASTGFAVLTPSKEVFSKFLNYILSADYFVNMVSQNSIGVSYPAITESKLVTIKIAISPDIEEQKEILEYIKPKSIAIDKAIVVIKKEIDLITEYRTTLISNVVTGKVDVRHIEVEGIINSIEEDFEDLDEGELSEELEMEEE